MGLDCYWSHDDWFDESGELDPDRVPSPDLDSKLVGGLFSGNGAGSFRGKVYAQFVLDHTGQSLYDENIPNDVVVDMADKLEAVEWNRVDENLYRAPRDEAEFDALVEMFRFYADEGARLVGWW